MRAFRFQLPLTRPLNTGRGTISHREGILLHDGRAWAEASPLPGFSSEQLGDVIASVRSNHDIPPSLHFAFSSLRQPSQACALPICPLLTGSAEQIIARAETLAQAGCDCVKLKVGRLNLEGDIQLVQRVRSLLRRNQALRLDANRAWSYTEAFRFARAMTEESIQYVEEPLSDPTRLEELTKATGIRYALDETLATTCDNLERFPNTTALVVKPTILGGGERLQRLARTGKPLVFSACFESGIGVARIARLSAQFSPDLSAGLDTYSFLSEDVLAQRLPIRDWTMHIPAEVTPREELLQEIAL